MANWNNLSVSASVARQINGGHLSITGSPMTIGNVLGSSNGISIFTDDYQPHVKKYEVFEIDEDLLLLSVVWQRMRKHREEYQNNNSGTFPFDMPTNITSDILFKNITTADRERTETIRDYYDKRLMLWALNEVRLSSFREDMKKLIQSNGKMFQENMKPLAYRLPEFYDYDIMFDDMFIEHNKSVKQTKQVEKKQKQFTVVKTFTRKRRHNTVKEFWFNDKNDNLNVITLTKDNPLLSLMEYHAKNPFEIEGFFTKKVRDNREYCVVEKYSFL